MPNPFIQIQTYYRIKSNNIVSFLQCIMKINFITILNRIGKFIHRIYLYIYKTIYEFIISNFQIYYVIFTVETFGNSK